MASQSRILAWKIPWPKEPDCLQSTGSLRVGHAWVTKQLKQQAWFGQSPWVWNHSFKPGEGLTCPQNSQHAKPKVDLPFHTAELTGRVSPTSWPHLLGAYSHQQRTGGKMRNAEILLLLEGKFLSELGKEKACVLSWRRLERSVHHTILDLTCFPALSQILMSSWSIRFLYLRGCKSIFWWCIILVVAAILFPSDQGFERVPRISMPFIHRGDKHGLEGGSFGHDCYFSR